MCESEVEPNYDDVNKERIFEDDVTSLSNEKIFKAFTFIAVKWQWNALDYKSDDNLIPKAMNVLKL